MSKLANMIGAGYVFANSAPDGGSGSSSSTDSGGDTGNITSSSDGTDSTSGSDDGNSSDVVSTVPSMDFGNESGSEDTVNSKEQDSSENESESEGTDYTAKAEELKGSESVEILKELSDEINKPPEDPAQGDKDHQDANNSDKILGRFDSQADLEKSWKEQNDIIKGRVKEMPTDELISQAQERGIIDKDAKLVVPTIPDKYDFAAVTSENITWATEDEAPEMYAEVTDVLKKAGMSQEGLGEIMPLVENLILQSIETFGAHVDVNAEKAALTEEWGQETDNTGVAVRDWAINEFGPEVFYKPLGATKRGMLLLKQLQDKAFGPKPITNQPGDDTRGNSPEVSVNSIQKALDEIRRRDAYTDQMHKDHVATHKEYDQLKARQLQLREERDDPYSF